MGNNAPIIFIKKSITRTHNKFIKLDEYINSNKKMTKLELKKLINELRKELHITIDAISPPEQTYDSDDL